MFSQMKKPQKEKNIFHPFFVGLKLTEKNLQPKGRKDSINMFKSKKKAEPNKKLETDPTTC